MRDFLLGSHLFEHFVAAKREEWLDYIKHVSPWEVERYLGDTNEHWGLGAGAGDWASCYLCRSAAAGSRRAARRDGKNTRSATRRSAVSQPLPT